MSIKAREADTCFTFFITTYIVQSWQGYKRSRTALSSLKLWKSLLIKLNLSLKSYDYFKCSFSEFKFFSYCHMVFQVDVDHSGTLDFDEFIFLYGHRVFQVDVDHSGTLDFDNFFFI